MTGYSQEAFDAIQRVFDDPGRAVLADRLDEMLALLDEDPDDDRLRRHRMQQPKVWAVFVHGSGEDWALLWDVDSGRQPYVHYAGPSWL